MKYKITVKYGDGSEHTIGDLTPLDLIAWLMGYIRNDVLRKSSSAVSVVSLTIVRE